MQTFTLLVIAGCVAYTVVAAVIICALRRVRSGSAEHTPRVSVIIAARNEEASLGACLDSLCSQEYPPDKFEVIVADDRSTDQTSELLGEYSSRWPSLHTVRIGRVPDGVSPKKNALASALSLAKGEIILQTDADCTVPPGWIAGMVNRFESGVGFVAGIAPYRKAPGTLNSFIRHEYLWNAALSASSIVLGRGTHASGRNMGFRRDVFLAVQGYGNSIRVLSGDDTLLLQRIERSRTARAATMPASETHVYTRAPQTLAAFVHQRIRHMSTGKFFDFGQILAGLVVYGFHGLLLFALISALIYPSFRMIGVSGFAWKTIMDALVASRVRAILELDVEWSRFVLNEFILLWYMILFPMAGIIIPVSWKRRPHLSTET